MKGNFTSGTEISLDISKVELSILEKESVKGLIKFIEDPSIIKNVKLGLGELEKNLGRTLGVPVLIQASTGGGKIVVRFANLEELNRVAKTIID